MNSGNVNKWLTLIANVAVVVGIVFLIVEINQNTAAIEQSATWMRLESLDNGTSQNSEFRKLLLTNDDLFDIWATNCGAGLNEADSARYRMLVADYLIQNRTNGERNLALGGTEFLDELADFQAREIHNCPLMRGVFENNIPLIALISPEWYASVERALARLDETQ